MQGTAARLSVQPSLLSLPDEILTEILVQTGPRSSTLLAQTCRHINAIYSENVTWKRFLELYDFPDHREIAASSAKETVVQHYCRSCDSIKSGIQMFYTGTVCIACEYKNPDNQERHFYCQSRFNRFRFGRRTN